MATMQDFADQVRAAIAADDLPNLRALFTVLHETNPEAAATLVAVAVAEYRERTAA